MCACKGEEICPPCQKRVEAAIHAKEVWDLAQRRMTLTKIAGLERALRVEHMPTKAKSIRNEIANLKASLS